VLWILLLSIVILILLLVVTNFISYNILKNRVLKSRRWDLNICCGRTDGGGVNADIFVHEKLPDMVRIDIYHLPFGNGQFGTVLCSHTIEHVDDPQAFFDELERVGKEVTLVLPPLWDLSAVLNVFEHQWIFLTLKKVHTRLPKYVRLPLSAVIQKIRGQRLHA
jgi:SAM-dependent methyltransferase